MPVHAITDNPFGDTAVAVYKRKTILTNGQIKSLPTIPVELTPSPGAGKILIGIYTVIVHKWVADYAVGTNRTMRVGYPGTGMVASNSLTEDNFDISNLLTLGLDGIATLVGASNAGGVGGVIDIENKPLVLKMSGEAEDFTGGDPANTLEVTVFYSIVDL